ncbi:SDR family oxidoreductase [Arthrobacter sp. H14-L1]|uniref:SDR family oxidoreductase n=1 Tax=Arthrobacter sp. H14-L1 TaxID=2996697 RepID=UPI00227040AD|nr:NAD(P)H-binding protein [Arthrobacter sp. H14-L1]MCY0905308.1 NAD(P)H-binding protein [Arthrobacter sp. H14-L1]
MSETIVVAGATGYVGRHVVEALDLRGYRVRALVRSRDRAEAKGAFGAPSLRGHVAEWRIVDYTDSSTLMDACQGADRVVSALGVTRQNASPWDIDFLGNLRLLEDAERHGAASFLYVNVLHCESGTSLTMRSKHAFSETLCRSRVAAQIVNPSGYFSDVTDFLLMARRGFGFTLGDGTAKINPIHGADLAEFIVEHLGEPSMSWDVGGPDILSYRELAELAFRVAGRRQRILRLRPAIVRPLQWAADRSSLRLSNLTRFFLESLKVDAVGTPTGERRIEPFLKAIH